MASPVLDGSSSAFGSLSASWTCRRDPSLPSWSRLSVYLLDCGTLISSELYQVVREMIILTQPLCLMEKTACVRILLSKMSPTEEPFLASEKAHESQRGLT